jgi:glycine hydroxymethyltransferase
MEPFRKSSASWPIISLRANNRIPPREACHVNLFTVDDPEVNVLMDRETERLQHTIDLIAAENHSPASVLAAQGSVFALKAAEGYPNSRFHAGCGPVDDLENLAATRCRTLFGADHANVQPHSGVAANLAVYFAVLDIGDRVLSMKLSDGGHLSHGAPASMTSRCFDFAHYGVDGGTARIDYDVVAIQAEAWQPRMIVAGASAYPRLIDYRRLAEIAAANDALFMVDMAHIAGLVAAGVIPSPVPHADFVTFTTYKTLMGGRGGVILCRNAYADRVDRSVFPGCQGTPAMNAVAAKAICFHLANKPAFRTLQLQTVANARCMAEAFISRGYGVVSGGTDNHLVLIDLRPLDLNGGWAEKQLEAVGLIANRNPIPGHRKTSGIDDGLRLGTPAITARGMQEPEVRRIVEWVDIVLKNPNREDMRASVKKDIAALCRQFPLPYGTAS